MKPSSIIEGDRRLLVLLMVLLVMLLVMLLVSLVVVAGGAGVASDAGGVVGVTQLINRRTSEADAD